MTAATMPYTKLGRSGLEVSRVALGCMSFGQPDRGRHAWTMPSDGAGAVIRRALELGINLFDTANVYSDGTSEEIVGHWLGRMARRDDVVIATKVHGRMHAGPNGAGLSRKHVLDQADASLRRLGVDHIDLYQLHRFDETVPVEETMAALADLVRAGKVRYLGVSSMATWQLAKLVQAGRAEGAPPFVSMQNLYNALYREEEREMRPFCLDAGLGWLPWSPLARGRLARPLGAPSDRAGSDHVAARLQAQGDERVIEAVGKVAERHDRPRGQVALAWLLARPPVAAPLVGVRGVGQLEEAVGALDLTLSPDDIAEIDSAYVTREVVPW